MWPTQLTSRYDSNAPWAPEANKFERKSFRPQIAFGLELNNNNNKKKKSSGPWPQVSATDVEEGMRVGVDRTKYQIQIPLPPKIDPTVRPQAGSTGTIGAQKFYLEAFSCL